MKTFLLLLGAVLATVQAQTTQSTPPHVLFTPQSYHVGTTERISFTSYGQQSFEVIAQVSYDDCTCESRGFRQCRNRGGVFSEARETAQLGRPTVLDVQMPGLGELQGRNYYITVTSHNGSVVYLSRRRISFGSGAFGFLLVKTDKPIYKPEQQVNFCVVYLDKSLKPFDSPATAEITVRDGQFKQILKLDSVSIEPGEFTCLDFPLSDEPNFGTWRIQANIKIPNEEGGCRVFFSTPSATCTFKVEEFVLPRFEVTLEVPKQLTREEDFITGKVSAKYTFGENVQGTVKLNATLTSSRRRETLLFFERTAELQNGQYSFRISADEYRALVRYRYDPFCVSSRVQMVAEVREAGRGAIQADSASFSLVANPVTVKFSDSNPQHFRPGLNYTVKAQVTLADGSPAINASVRLTATTNNEQRVLFDDPLTSDGVDGSLTVPIPVPLDANCLKITLSPVEEFPACETPRVCFSPSPFFSPTKSFLQLEDVSRFTTLRVGGRAVIQATSTVPFGTLHLLVISQGDVQHHTSKTERGGSTSTVIQFRLTSAMVPKVKVLGVFARTDGELVADLIELTVQCQLENQVDVSFNQSRASPADPISISTATSPNSVVLLSVIDKSLTLLADACRSLEQDNVCNLLRSLTRGSLPGGSTCDSDTSDACCPSSCSEPTKYAVGTIFSAAGVSIQSNMFQPSPPVIRRPTPSFPDYRFPDIAFEVGRPGQPGPLLPAPAPTEAVPAPDDNEVDLEGGDDESGVRTFFPESWIWTLQRTDDAGTAITNSTVPDTITTWVAEAFSLSPTQGLGLSPLTELTVTKPFFVSLELPFSINFGETVTITPLVFFFGPGRRTRATVTVAVDDELDLVENSFPTDGPVFIQNGRSVPFNLKLRPRAIGQLAITVAAVGSRGQRDTVRKLLFVKPGCEKFEITQNVFAEDSGSQCFNYSLPSCVIPGSAKATISVTGDVMSPPNLDRLLVLPHGCGEQNLVRTATNWVVAEYLVATRQLSDFIAVKIRNNIQTGYQRELTYLQSSGCFSIWSRGSCSLWLTAAVVNTFTGIVDFYREQEPGMEIVDQAVITGALNYILSNQEKSGRLPIVGRVHNFGLVDDIAHSAFGLLALKSYVQTFEGDDSASSTVRRARTGISNAEKYLLDQYNQTGDFCNYGLALTTYAVLRCQEKPPETLNRMLDDLRGRITNSRTYPGACFLCNDCPSDDEDSTPDRGTDCIGRPRNEGSAACVETTAYALLALLEGGDTQYTVCLAQWLVRIRSGSGGYWSSQDTVVALQALATFAESTYSQVIDKTIVFNLPGLSSSVTTTITTDNRFERFDVEVPSVPSNNNCVRWSGNGTAILQSTVEYHGCNCCNDTRAFSLELASTRESTPLGDTLELSIRVRYLQGISSNMAIVDVEIPSGFLFAGWRFLDEFAKNAVVERVDTRGSNVIFYLTDVPSRLATTIIVEFIEQFSVEDPQQLPVTVYDYYDPGQTVTKYYLPETSPPLRQTTVTPPTETEPLPGARE